MIRNTYRILLVLTLTLALWLAGEQSLQAQFVQVFITAPSSNSKWTYGGGSTIPGILDISAAGYAIPAAWTNALLWITSQPPTGSTETITPATGPSVQVRLSGLPTYNSGFGAFSVGAFAGMGGGASVSIKLFFPGDDGDVNHPGAGSGVTPNWYYYWGQTSAGYGTHNFDTGYAGGGYTGFVNGAWRSYIGFMANDDSPSGTWNNAHGIDFFANGCRHEERHRLDFSTLWGANNNRSDAADPDVDYLPTDNGTVTENSLGFPYHAAGYDPTVTASVPDDLNYGAGFRDCEDYALHREASWTNLSAKSTDWSNPGQQF